MLVLFDHVAKKIIISSKDSIACLYVCILGGGGGKSILNLPPHLHLHHHPQAQSNYLTSSHPSHHLHLQTIWTSGIHKKNPRTCADAGLIMRLIMRGVWLNHSKNLANYCAWGVAKRGGVPIDFV